MRFLRDQAMQGAGFFVAILVMILQFPEHLVWLLPLSVLFIVLLYVGHQQTSKSESADNNLNTGWNNVREKTVLFSRNWLTPSIAILVIIVSSIFTIRGILNKAHVGWVEKVEFRITRDTKLVSLHTIVPNGAMRNILFDIKSEVNFFEDENGFLSAHILFNNPRLGIEDSGIDPENIILEPNGSFVSSESSLMGDEYYTSFDLSNKHTYFVRLENDALIRIHVAQFPQIPPKTLKGDYLILYVSYVPTLSERFDGLTEPSEP